MASELQVPMFLPNGMTLVHDSNFFDRLHNGDASVGWVGDPRLGVYHEGGRIELWRWCEDGEPRLIVRSRPGMDRLDSGLLRFLAEHDSLSRRRYNVRDDIDSHNARVERDAQAAAKGRMEDLADRLQFALRKDIGAYEGGSTKRLHTLPEAPWKRKKNDAQ